MIALLKLALLSSMFLLVVSIGMRVTLAELRAELAHPGSIVRALFAIGVAMPLATMLVVRALPLERVVEVTLLALSMSPLPPGLLLKHGRVQAGTAYTAALLVVLGACAIGTIPFWIAVAREAAGLRDSVELTLVARIVGVGLVLPIVVGLALRALVPAFAEHWAPRAHRLSVALVLLLLVPLVVLAAPAM
ncbi:MAG TPA: hypothetical protein VFL14_12110, partial [Xanthomonadales bacterium]|nr:hypothetical protein [Xanthomonadales bacterium]